MSRIGEPPQNAAFIAHARADVPKLLEVKAAEVARRCWSVTTCGPSMSGSNGCCRLTKLPDLLGDTGARSSSHDRGQAAIDLAAERR